PGWDGSISAKVERSFSRLAKGVKDLHAMIKGVGDEDPAVCADGDAGGQPEFTGSVSAFADVQQQLARRIKNLEIVKHRVHDMDVSRRIHRHALGPREVAGSVAVAAELREKI